MGKRGKGDRKIRERVEKRKGYVVQVVEERNTEAYVAV